MEETAPMVFLQASMPPHLYIQEMVIPDQSFTNPGPFLPSRVLLSFFGTKRSMTGGRWFLRFFRAKAW